MKTHTVTTYSYDELSELAKENAVNNLADVNIFDEWWQDVYEDANNIELQINEFDLDRNRYVKGEFIGDAFDTAMLIVSDHGEDCETYKTAINYLEERDCLYCSSTEDEYGDLDIEDELDSIDNEFLKSLCEDYSIMLQKEYEFLGSKEAIEEMIRVNEYEFLENGKLYH